MALITQIPEDRTRDIAGRPYARLSELKHGDAIEIDGGFTCQPAGRRIVWHDGERDGSAGLYFSCGEGAHYLDGQADDGDTLVGVYLPGSAG